MRTQEQTDVIRKRKKHRAWLNNTHQVMTVFTLATISRHSTNLRIARCGTREPRHDDRWSLNLMMTWLRIELNNNVQKFETVRRRLPMTEITYGNTFTLRRRLRAWPIWIPMARLFHESLTSRARSQMVLSGNEKQVNGKHLATSQTANIFGITLFPFFIPINITNGSLSCQSFQFVKMSKWR